MTDHEIADQYPSTFDMPPMMGAQDDPVELMLVQARKRIKRSHTRSNYIGGFKEEGKKKVSKAASVCAIGAILAEDGFEQNQVRSPPAVQILLRERSLSETAQEAIASLNEVAVLLHPEARDSGTWSGPA